MAAEPAPCPEDTGKPGVRYVLRGASVLSMDPAIGDFERADVLVEGPRIAAVAPHVAAPGAPVVDVSGHIVMPGFVDTHHHQFETALRGFLADALLFDDGTPESRENYADLLVGRFAPAYRPEDVYISELVGSLSQLDAGVTTVLDLSQIHNSPEHTDAAIDALRDSGKRAVLCYSESYAERSAYPGDIRRLVKRPGERLLTLALGGEPHREDCRAIWSLARELGLPIAAHVVGHFSTAEQRRMLAGMLGPDNLLIHVTGMPDDFWRALADSGAAISLAVPVEMTMRHGMPPLQRALEFGVQPSLSSDVECTVSADFFTQMRSAMALQRALANERALAGERPAPRLLACRDVLGWATLEGARALGLDASVGSLTPGKQADIIALDAAALNVAPLNNAPGAVVALMERCNVAVVAVAGRIRKWRGRLLGVDAPRLLGELAASRDHLFAAAGVERDLFGSPLTRQRHAIATEGQSDDRQA